MDSDHEELAELDTSFKLKPRSKFHTLSIPQTEADAALSASSRSGIVVFPCGAGKTALFVRAAMRNYNVLVLSYESQGVLQVADVVLEETDVGKDLLCCYTAEKRTEPNRLSCFMVATYSMFAGSAHKQSNHTRAVSEFVFYQTQWDLVVCDECQHAPADTFREVIEKLRPNAKRILGFTGTLCRSQLGPGVEERIRRGELTRDEATERHFDFIGPVLFRRSCADLEATGDIAKLHLRRIETPAISHEAYFCRAHALTEGVTRLYLAAMHPCKLRALWNILHMHQSRGDQGMIFVDHLVHAAVLKNMLGKRCEVLAGADMEDMARSTSAIGNRELVKKFNAGELDVIIASPVGESSLDTYSERFRFIIVFDAHGGAAAASQRLGRAARTSRVQHDVADVEQSQLIERQRKRSASTTSSSRRSPRSTPRPTSAASNSRPRATRSPPSNTPTLRARCASAPARRSPFRMRTWTARSACSTACSRTRTARRRRRPAARRPRACATDTATRSTRSKSASRAAPVRSSRSATQSSGSA